MTPKVKDSKRARLFYWLYRAAVRRRSRQPMSYGLFRQYVWLTKQ